MTNITQEERLEWREHFGEVISYNIKDHSKLLSNCVLDHYFFQLSSISITL